MIRRILFNKELWWTNLIMTIVTLVYLLVAGKMVANLIINRIEIAEMAPKCVVTDGIVESVNKHSVSYKATSTTNYDTEYTAIVSYHDMQGTTQVFTSKRSDKWFWKGKKVKVAYNPEDHSTMDIAYFDILVWNYIPRYMNKYRFFTPILIILLLILAYAFLDIIVKANMESIQKDEQQKPKKQ